MPQTIRVRPAQLADVPAVAQVIVQAWGETYRGLIPDRILDDPEFSASRERRWTTVLTDPRFTAHRVAVGEVKGSIVGIAMSGPGATESDPFHLYVLYVLKQWHGSGAGTTLLEAVLAPWEAATLWVADPNPRAQAFYRKHGFRPDGLKQVEDALPVIHMIRASIRDQA